MNITSTEVLGGDSNNVPIVTKKMKFQRNWRGEEYVKVLDFSRSVKTQHI